MGVLIAIEGIDGAGKGTQSAKLCDRLNTDGYRTRLISFPRYAETAFGTAIGDFLNGRFGQLDQVSPFLTSVLYAGDRFESRDLLETARQENDVVVLDRYTASNVAHQAAKLDGAERGELSAWIRRIEFDVFHLPRVDLNLLLDLPVNLAQELIARKSKRAYTDRAADLHEADSAYLTRVRELYLECAEMEDNWQIIECASGDMIREPNDIAGEIRTIVNSCLPDQPHRR